MKVKSESEVAQSCPIISDPMDCSLPGASVHGIFQTRLLEWAPGGLPDPGIKLASPVSQLPLYWAGSHVYITGRFLETRKYLAIPKYCVLAPC